MISDCVCNRKDCVSCEKCFDCNLMCDCVECSCTELMLCPKCYLSRKQHKEYLMDQINLEGPFSIESSSEIVDDFSYSFDAYVCFTFIILKDGRRLLIIRDDVRFRVEVVEVPVEKFKSLMQRFLN